MNKRERVMAAIHGEKVDRLPIGFWKHNYATEHSAEVQAAEAIRLYEAFDWDFLKPQCAWHTFGEMWGLRVTPSYERDVRPVIDEFPVTRLEDFGKLKPVDPRKGTLGKQLEALKTIRAKVGKDVPIVATVFAPIMVAMFLIPERQAGVEKLMRDHPDEFERGLAAISETLADYARLVVDSGIDGLFYATIFANHGVMDSAQFARFERPFDMQILDAAKKGPFNVMHMCGDSILFDEFATYPPVVFNWAATPGNPTLSEVHQRTGYPVMGGLPANPVIGGMSPEALIQHAEKSMAEMQGRFHILAPDCAINTDTPDALMHAIGKLVREGAPA